MKMTYGRERYEHLEDFIGRSHPPPQPLDSASPADVQRRKKEAIAKLREEIKRLRNRIAAAE